MDTWHGATAFVLSHLDRLADRALDGVLFLPVLVIGFWLLERVRPVAPPSAARKTGFRTDLYYYLISPVFDGLTSGAGALCMIAVAVLAGAQLDAKLLHGFGPVMQQPAWLIWIEMLVLLDLLSYASHRMFHTVPWLWRFHAVHHSSTRLNWLSAVRRHPFNDLVTHCVNATVLFALGFPIATAMQLLPFVAMHAMVTHSDLDFRGGPFAACIVSPVYHRYHHAHPAQGGNHNFAALFPIVDKLFGTYYLPEGLPRSLGVEERDVPDDVLGQLAHPFRREPSPSGVEQS